MNTIPLWAPSMSPISQKYRTSIIKLIFHYQDINFGRAPLSLNKKNPPTPPICSNIFNFAHCGKYIFYRRGKVSEFPNNFFSSLFCFLPVCITSRSYELMKSSHILGHQFFLSIIFEFCLFCFASFWLAIFCTSFFFFLEPFSRLP